MKQSPTKASIRKLVVVEEACNESKCAEHLLWNHWSVSCTML